MQILHPARRQHAVVVRNIVFRRCGDSRAAIPESLQIGGIQRSFFVLHVNESTFRVRHTGGRSDRQAAAKAVMQHAQLRKFTSQFVGRFFRMIRGTIVDDDHFKLSRQIWQKIQQIVDLTSQCAFHVVDRQNDAERLVQSNPLLATDVRRAARECRFRLCQDRRTAHEASAAANERRLNESQWFCDRFGSPDTDRIAGWCGLYLDPTFARQDDADAVLGGWPSVDCDSIHFTAFNHLFRVTTSAAGPDFSRNDGLLPAIAQDATTGEVLMMAWMNEEAFAETQQTGRAVYYSRSRKRLWRKGEESGHFQFVKQILVDCDRDTILLKVEQNGAACHEGYRSCFFRAVTADGLRVVAERLVNPADIYHKP